MLQSLLRKWRVRSRSPDLLSAAICGLWLACWLHQSAAAFGTSLVSFSAIAVVVGGTMAGVSWLAGRRPTAGTGAVGRTTRMWSVPVAHLALAGVGPLSDMLISGGLQMSSAVITGAEWPSVTRQWLSLTLGSLVLVPLIGLVSFVQAFGLPVSGSTSGSGRMAGLTAGLCLATFVLMPVTGLTSTLLMAAAGSCLLFVAAAWLIVRSGTAGEFPRRAAAADSSGDASVAVPSAAGIAFALICRMTEQWMMTSAWVTVAQWSGVLAGCAVTSIVPAGWRRGSSMNWMLALWCVLLVLLFPAILSISLDVNSWIASVTAVTAIRTGVLMLTLLPVGILLAGNTNADWPERGLPRAMTVVGFVAGVLTARWLIIPGGELTTGLIWLCSLLFVSGVIHAYHELEPVTVRDWMKLSRRPLFVLCAPGVLMSPFWSAFYREELSAKLLFDTNVFLANRIETRTDMLPWLDEARCLDVVEADQHTLSLWRVDGSRLQLRESGLATSTVSSDANLCPEPTAESLRAILPLTLHRNPRRLLLLGAGAGAVLKTSLAFPVRQITCVEADRQQLAVVQQQVLPRLDVDPSTDSRVTMVNIDPSLALRSTQQSFDVVVSDAGHLALSSAAPETTAEFLQQGLRVIGSKGLFCQRLVYADLGPEAVRDIFRTWQSVFPHVCAFETGSGEFLMIGSRRAGGIFPQKIVQRVKRPHVRYALSRIGWDWATLLQLPVFQGEDLAEAFAGERSRVSRVGNAALMIQLPCEVMRWGNKYDDLMARMAPCRQRLCDIYPDERMKPEVTRRFTEVAEQQQLVQLAHDRYWAYRKSVKHFLTNAPRTQIIQVKGEEAGERLHAEEQRRLDYFETLGAAAKQRSPSSDSLLAIEAFAEPYDPLISFFLHQELAELAARNRSENAAIELRHRLYRIHFATPGDRSVRNIIAAIELICERPELISDPARRGDHLDALLQILHGRWQNRGDVPPDSSKIVLNDIEKSIQAAETAFESLEELAAARGMSGDEWKLRELVLKKSLVRPLRDYRTMLMPHGDRERRDESGEL